MHHSDFIDAEGSGRQEFRNADRGDRNDREGFVSKTLRQVTTVLLPILLNARRAQAGKAVLVD